MQELIRACAAQAAALERLAKSVEAIAAELKVITSVPVVPAGTPEQAEELPKRVQEWKEAPGPVEAFPAKPFSMGAPLFQRKPWGNIP
jgi:hypothetical protein